MVAIDISLCCVDQISSVEVEKEDDIPTVGHDVSFPARVVGEVLNLI